LKIFLEGFIYKYQAYGGVTRLLNETLPRICALDPTLSFEIVTLEGNLHQVPIHEAISIRRVPFKEFRGWRPRPFWRHVEPLINRWRSNRAIFEAIGDGHGAIWHAPFYRIPGQWDGPIVTTMLDMAYERFPQLFRSPTHHWLIRTKRECVEKSDAVICISEATRQDVLSFCRIAPEKTFVVHLAPGDAFQPIDQPEENPHVQLPDAFLMHLGNRSLNKNFDFLLNAYSTWPMRHDLPLLVVGSDWHDGEWERILDLGIEKNVIRMDHQEDAALAALYRRATAFIFPSLYEGFGIPLLEAMACGCPIVASRIPSTLEVAGDIPYYFDPLSIQEFHSALDQAVGEGYASKRRQAGLTWSRQYSWEKSAIRTLDIYRQVYAGHS
jgi:glycosyltransferase involved in cell wall biosynthesis